MVINTDHLDGEMSEEQREIVDAIEDSADTVYVYTNTVEAEFYTRDEGNHVVKLRDLTLDEYQIESAHIGRNRSVLYFGKGM